MMRPPFPESILGKRKVSPSVSDDMTNPYVRLGEAVKAYKRAKFMLRKAHEELEAIQVTLPVSVNMVAIDGGETDNE